MCRIRNNPGFQKPPNSGGGAAQGSTAMLGNQRGNTPVGIQGSAQTNGRVSRERPGRGQAAATNAPFATATNTGGYA